MNLYIMCESLLRKKMQKKNFVSNLIRSQILRKDLMNFYV